MADYHEPTSEELVDNTWASLPEPVRTRFPEAWTKATCVYWWSVTQIDGRFVTELWQTNEGAARVLAELDSYKND